MWVENDLKTRSGAPVCEVTACSTLPPQHYKKHSMGGGGGGGIKLTIEGGGGIKLTIESSGYKVNNRVVRLHVAAHPGVGRAAVLGAAGPGACAAAAGQAAGWGG